MNNYDNYCNDLERALLLVDKEAAEKVILEASSKNPVIDVVSNVVTGTLGRIGELWETGNLSLSQVYMSGIICEELIDNLMPPKSKLRVDQPRMAIGVFEDYHLLGKRIVYSSLRASGYELTDLGAGLTTRKIVDLVQKEKVKILLLSVLMLPSALRIKELRAQLPNDDFKLIVGGAPFRFDEELWKEVGADGYGNDSSEAIQLVSRFINELNQ